MSDPEEEEPQGPGGSQKAIACLLAFLLGGAGCFGVGAVALRVLSTPIVPSGRDASTARTIRNQVAATLTPTAAEGKISWSTQSGRAVLHFEGAIAAKASRQQVIDHVKAMRRKDPSLPPVELRFKVAPVESLLLND